MLPDPNYRATPSVRPRRRLARALPMAIALFAIAVFGGLIGYTYMTRTGEGDGVAPTIRADQRPMKSRPDNPGGMDVPHQDKEIYDRLARSAGGTAAPAQKVERLLPPPEAPLPRPVAPPPITAQIPAPPDVSPPPGAVEVTQAQAVKPPAPPPPSPPAAAPPRPQSLQPPQQAPAPRLEPIAPAAIAPAAGPTTGRYRVQLAALRSPEEADREWEKLRRAHPDLLGGLSVTVVRADLGERGTFYRVQAGPMADEANAKDLCRKLVDKKVGCLVVRP